MAVPCQLTNAEIDLLLACARTRVDADARESIDGLLRGPITWRAILDAAGTHGVVPLLHAALSRADRSRLPRDVQERLRIQARANVHHALFMAAELRRLEAVFQRAGVAAIPFKGPVLAQMVYGDLTLRQFSDLDLFVHRSELATLAQLLLANGYLSDHHDGGAATRRAIDVDGEVAYREPSHYTFYRPDGRCRIDLQWRMSAPFFAFSLETSDAAWHFLDVSIAGRNIRTFCATDTLMILCVHGSKHRFEKLKWLCDVAECLRAQQQVIDWDALQRKAARLRAGRMLRLGLRLAHEMLGAPLPPDIAAQLLSDRTLEPLVREVRTHMFARPAQSASAPQVRFYLQAKDGWRDRASFCGTYVRQVIARAVAPNERDTSWITLPPRLKPLYYIVRPVRLITAYARAARSSRAAKIPLPTLLPGDTPSSVPTKPSPTKGASQC